MSQGRCPDFVATYYCGKKLKSLAQYKKTIARTKNSISNHQILNFTMHIQYQDMFTYASAKRDLKDDKTR